MKKITTAQNHLISLGFDLGLSGADGDWGRRSTIAAKTWQDLNNYEPTGDITERQMDALAMQAEHPSIFRRIQMQDFYDNLDTDLLSDLDPVRRAVFIQTVSHMGAQEIGRSNTGPAVEQYFESDDRLVTGSSWCSAFGSWNFDQVEQFAGIETDAFMEGNMRVRELLSHIQNTTPEAIKDGQEYLPQTGDFILITKSNGTSHFSTVAEAIRTPEGDLRIVTVDGNLAESVGPREYYLHHAEGSTNDMTESFDLESPYNSHIYPNSGIQLHVVDISELPNYDAMNAYFHAKGEFIPTPSADPNFQLDTVRLNRLQTTMQVMQEIKAPSIDGSLLAENTIVPDPKPF